jgi:predicted glycosyltransferase
VAKPAQTGRRSRVALYSHDTMGLGHRRRNLLVAHALAGAPLHASTLLVVGAAASVAWPQPPGSDCLSLPALRKEPDGRYGSRSLDLSLATMVGLRSSAIRAALSSFEPDVLIVDNVPDGALGELLPTLQHLKQRGRTRCVLGLRDVLDDPAATREEWRRKGHVGTVGTYYDAVWVYSDPYVCDPIRHCGLAPLADRVRYTGYLDHRRWLEIAEPGGDALGRLRLPPGRLALCVVGGGQDGDALAEAFADAELPEGCHGLVVTGPFMPEDVRARLRARLERRPRLRVLPGVGEPARFIAMADRVIAMAGYNTVGEILSFGKEALLVPRIKPRSEQLTRAERLRELGLVDLLHPTELSPAALGAWLARTPARRAKASDVVDMRGLSRLPEFLADALASPSRAGN